MSKKQNNILGMKKKRGMKELEFIMYDRQNNAFLPSWITWKMGVQIADGIKAAKQLTL